MSTYEAELTVAKMIARQAGAVMRQYFDGDQQTEIKYDGSPVTVADKLINRMVIEELAKAFPEDVVIGEEESTGEYGMGRRWFCDPVNGTKAYTWGCADGNVFAGACGRRRPYGGCHLRPIS